MLEESKTTEFLVIYSKNSQNQIVKKPLRELIKKSIKYYFINFKNNKDVNNLYALAISEIEKPLLDIVMQYTRGNQTKASLIMGINRSTLRKKLKKYGMS